MLNTQLMERLYQLGMTDEDICILSYLADSGVLGYDTEELLHRAISVTYDSLDGSLLLLCDEGTISIYPVDQNTGMFLCDNYTNKVILNTERVYDTNLLTEDHYHLEGLLKVVAEFKLNEVYNSDAYKQFSEAFLAPVEVPGDVPVEVVKEVTLTETTQVGDVGNRVDQGDIPNIPDTTFKVVAKKNGKLYLEDSNGKVFVENFKEV